MKPIYSILSLFSCCFAVSFVAAQSPIRPGDRIAIVGNTFADQLRVHGYLESRLLQSFPENPVSIRNMGWGGDMLTARSRPTNFASEESTLAGHKTDVIIACFGFGESFGGQKMIGQFQTDLRAFIASHAGKKYNGQSEVRLVLVSPIAYEDLGEITPEREKRNLDLKAYTAAMKEVAANSNVPFVDLFAPSLYIMNERQGPNLTSNGIHLNRYGYWSISKVFCQQLVAEDHLSTNEFWQLIVDAKAGSATGRGVEISELTIGQSNVSFLVSETSAPRLPPPTDQAVPPPLELQRDTLRVENLDPGTYRLTIDEKLVATATAEQWNTGVPVDSSPTHLETEELRQTINDKNLQFIYSWKALNQVHIVGERKSSQSGKELPREVIEFNELANQRDALIRNSVKRKTRRWKVAPVK